jgi:two-component system, NarL family, invasion response regulator UvrY
MSAGLRVYLVDDHPMLREGLRATLTAAGHRVLGATGDPTVASAEIRQLRPEVLLLDLTLGARSGLELLQDLDRRGASVPTLVLTMSAQPRHVADALKAGALGYLLKGASAQELLHAMAEVSVGHRFMAPELADYATQVELASRTDAGLDSLSVRERQIARLVVQGRSSQQIATALHLSPKTVDTYRSRLMGKLGVADIPALVRLAIRVGLIDTDDP